MCYACENNFYVYADCLHLTSLQLAKQAQNCSLSSEMVLLLVSGPLKSKHFYTFIKPLNTISCL